MEVESIGTNPDTYEDYRRLLDRKDIDAVPIATPRNLHSRMTIDSLHAGKHVFIERSTFFKEEEAGPIRQAAAEPPKQILQVGLHRRSGVLYQVATEMMRKGALDRVLLVGFGIARVLRVVGCRHLHFESSRARHPLRRGRSRV
jgi:predicted dehydrogenase